MNVMMGDVGSVADFGFDSLSARDLLLLKRADVVCVFNWNLNLRGTNLAQHTFELVKREGAGITFFDSGDPSVRPREICQLMERVLKRELVDVFSLNENEALWYASLIDESIRRTEHSLEAALECARILSEVLKSRIDLHTAEFSASFRGGRETLVPTLQVKPLRSTGAGDAWNAGDIYGECAGFGDEERLLLANAVAGFYMSNELGRHPTREDLTRFLKEVRLKAPDAWRK